MAKPVLSKSVRSDWFFWRDFAVRKPFIFVLEQSLQIQKLQPKQRKKCEYCYFSQPNYQKKLKRLKFYRDLKDG